MQRGPDGRQPHPMLNSPLIGKFDADPGNWRPLYYYVEVSVGVAAGSVALGTISMNNQPYILTRAMAKIVGDTYDPTTTGLAEDGQYDILFKDEQSNYQNQSIPANLMWGWVQSGFVMELPYPLPYAGSKTLSFEVTNRVTRTLVPTANYFTVGIVVHGVSYWGKLAP